MEVGSIVRFRGGREGNEGEIYPAIVIGEWPDGSLQLFAFQFESSRLVYSIPADQCEVVYDPAQLRLLIQLLSSTPAPPQPDEAIEPADPIPSAPISVSTSRRRQS
jgi:hypothetical protein